MHRRSVIALALGLSLFSAPALAKSKAKEPAPPPAPVMSAVVDPDPSHDPDNVLALDLSNGGRVLIRLMPTWAPNHVERIKTLTRQGFYNGVVFHRVIDGFMAQTGDPTGTGQGGSKLPDLKAEFNYMPHVRGTVSMARTNEPDTANSQFFIVFYPRFALDHRYTNFGRVIAGMDTVDRIERGEPPANPTKVLQASLLSEGKAQAKPAPAVTAIPDISADMLSKSKSN
ncbi:MAG: peptidylprolyl isomerase [Proteobacteria bacterium]|nr:peptidylprolyl isomerase [Pseudomonadota bacterium]